MYTCIAPDSSDTYAIQRPSGENCPPPSNAGVFTTAVAGALLRIEMMYTSCAVSEFCREMSNCSPSGETEVGKSPTDVPGMGISRPD